MPYNTSLEHALEIQKKLRKSVSAAFANHMKSFAAVRESQIQLSQSERSKFNFLAFAIVGGVLSFRSDSLQSKWVLLGLFLILANAVLFGFVADYFQRKLNIRSAEKAAEALRDAFNPYADAYTEMGRYLDSPYRTQQGLQQKISNIEEKLGFYYEKNRDLSRRPIIAETTFLSIKYWYFVIFSIAILILGYGLASLPIARV
jgi:hypothetical protein